VAKYDSYRDDPYPGPGEQPTRQDSSPDGPQQCRRVLRLIVIAVVGVLGVAAIYLWARIFICDLWGPLFHGGPPGAFGRFCR
jgi:hypothetical protein